MNNCYLIKSKLVLCPPKYNRLYFTVSNILKCYVQTNRFVSMFVEQPIVDKRRNPMY